MTGTPAKSRPVPSVDGIGHTAARRRFPLEVTHLGDIRVTCHLYGGKTRNGEIIFGGDRQLVGYNYNPDANGIEVNRGHASEVNPLVARLPISRTWAGIMPFTMDGQPIIGRVPHFENLFIVTGLASSGFGRGPWPANYRATTSTPATRLPCWPSRTLPAASS